MRDLVIHGPTGLELDFAEDDFGGPRQSAVIATWAQRGRALDGEFICYAHRNHEKPWLYLRHHGRSIVAAHWPGSKLDNHQITHGVSDEHKRQVEYISRAGEAAGFTVGTEVSLPTKVRSDAVIYGPTATGIEVQRSSLAVKAAKARTTKARHAGVLPIWFSDSDRNPAWLFRVPGVRMNEQPWNTVLPPAGSVTVVSGVRTITARRCRNIPNSPCPNRPRGCNRWHPVHEPRLGMTVDDLAALIPVGQLVPINYKTLSRGAYTLIVDRNDKERYEAVSGTSADLPLRPKERLVRTGDRASCSADAGAVVVGAPTCCGRSLWPAGGPLVPACQLCPKAPTYWREEPA